MSTDSHHSAASSRDTVWYTRCPAPTPFGIAIQQGALADELRAASLTFRALQDSDDVAVRDSHYTHTQPWSFRQGGNIPALWARASGTQTRLIGLSWTDEFQGIIALEGSDIHTAADLAGRRLAVVRNEREDIVDFHRATILRGYTSLLDTAGLTLDDVELVEVSRRSYGLSAARGDSHAPLAARFAAQRGQEFSREIKALFTGEADAVFVKGASGLEAANLIGARIVVDLSSQPDRRKHANNGTPRPLTVDARLLEERPDLVDLIIAHTLNAADWAHAHPNDARTYIAREVRSSERWVGLAYGGELAAGLSFGLDESALAGLDDFKRFLVETKFLPADFDFADWVASAPLERVLAAREHSELAA